MAHTWQAGFEQLAVQLGKPLEQAGQRVCALQGAVRAGLEAATERLLAASRAEAEQEVHAQHTFERIDARGTLAARRHLPSRRAPRTQARTPARPPLLPPCAAGEARPRARGERAPARGVTRRHGGGAARGARRGASRRIRGARGLSACPTRERAARRATARPSMRAVGTAGRAARVKQKGGPPTRVLALAPLA